MEKEQVKRLVGTYVEKVGKRYDEKSSVKYKEQSLLLKLVRPVLEIFNKRYWNGYVTTLGSTIYVPNAFYDRSNVLSCLQTTAHEVIHIAQAKRQPYYMHETLYMFPQVLALLSALSLLAIPFSIGWLWSLLFLLFLLPLPAPFRYKKELEAYRTTILFYKHVYGASDENVQWAKDKIIKNLSKGDYYFCWPFPQKIQADLDKSDQHFGEEQYQEMLDFLKRHNLM